MNATYNSNEFVARRTAFSSFSTQVPRLKVEYQVRAADLRAGGVAVRGNAAGSAAQLAARGPLLERRADGSYVPSVSRQSNLLRTDWLFSYRPRPGTVFFAGYGGSMTETEPLAFDGLRRTTDGFFAKASWVFQRNSVK